MQITFLKYFFGLSIIASTCFSCKKENRFDCVKSTGAIVEEYRSVQLFDKIILQDNVNVFITQDSIFEVKVVAGEKLISNISTEVLNGVLTIKNNNRCNWVRSYKKEMSVYVKLPEIKYITNDGSGTIKSLNVLTTDIIDVQTNTSGDIDLIIDNAKILTHLHKSGDITIKGKTGEHACYATGNGFVNCGELETNYTWIWSYTTGNAFVNSNGILIGIINWTGDVYYSGNPTLDTLDRGKGNFIHQ